MIRTFLDTGVLIHAARGTSEVASTVMQILDDNRREFIVSTILELELLPMPVFHSKVQEVALYKAYIEHASIKVIIDEELLRRAIQRAMRLGLSAIDSIHLESALSVEADQFITSEKPTKRLFSEKDLKVISVHQLK